MKKLFFIFIILVFLFILVNLSYINESIEVHKISVRGKVNNPKFVEYVQNTAEIRTRGCTAGAKIISLKCNNFLSTWALGRYSRHIDEEIFQQKLEHSNNVLKKISDYSIIYEK